MAADDSMEVSSARELGYDPWRYFRLGLTLFLSLTIVSSVIYYLLGFYFEKYWSFLDCLFMVVITLSTIGYGDWLNIQTIQHPHAWVLKVYTMGLVIAGLGVPAFIISNVTALIMDGIMGDTFRRKRMEQAIAKLSGHVVVCGAGATGQHCIQELVKLGRQVVVVDQDAELLRRVQAEIGDFLYVVGRADRDEILQHAGVERASGLVAALADDKDNLFVTLSAKLLNPDLRIISKGIDDHVRKKMLNAGANSVVSPTAIGGLRMVSELVRPATTSFLDGMLRQKTNWRFDELEVGLDSPLAGKTLAIADLRQIADVLVVAARHPGVESFIYNPKADFKLEPQCMLVVLGQVNEVEKLRPYFGVKKAITVPQHPSVD